MFSSLILFAVSLYLYLQDDFIVPSNYGYYVEWLDYKNSFFFFSFLFFSFFFFFKKEKNSFWVSGNVDLT